MTKKTKVKPVDYDMYLWGFSGAEPQELKDKLNELFEWATDNEQVEISDDGILYFNGPAFTMGRKAESNLRYLNTQFSNIVGLTVYWPAAGIPGYAQLDLKRALEAMTEAKELFVLVFLLKHCTVSKDGFTSSWSRRLYEEYRTKVIRVYAENISLSKDIDKKLVAEWLERNAELDWDVLSWNELKLEQDLAK